MTETTLPAISGHIAPGFEPVRDAFLQNFEDADELGAGFAAYVGDEVVADIHGGWMDRAQAKPWAANTMVPVFSTTKGISALVIARLLDDHPDATYDTPVADVWPEFAAEGKGAVTIAQMLSHQAGLSGFVDPIDPALWLDPPACAAAIAALPPIWPLGGGSGYHPLTWGYLAGELALRLSGETLGTTLRRIFTNSDGADRSREIIDFRIGTPASEHPRIAELKKPKSLSSFGEINAETKAAFLTKWSAADRREPAWREKEIPSANGIGTAAAVARLYSVYAHHGRLGDQQVLSDDIVDALTARRVIGQDRVLPFVMEFAAGVKRNNNLIFGPNPNTLGHAGWGGSAAFGDPEAEIAAAYVCNQQGAHLQGDPRATRVFEALYACL